jgi:hypothetical protein
MHKGLLFAHLVFGAIWLGCILTEAVFERVLLAGDRSSQRALADLHVRVDLLVELPALLLVLGTGSMMAIESFPETTWFRTMLACGAGAVGLNLFCIWLVIERRSAAAVQAWSRFARLDHLQHKAGAGVLLLVLAAFLAGGLGCMAR